MTKDNNSLSYQAVLQANMTTKKFCQLCEKEFEITDDDLAYYKRISVPLPKLCPDDRQRRRTAFRNERFLYKRKCDGTKRNIISMYSPDKPFPVYMQEYFWSDKWDPLDYGMDFDFNRPFFDQMKELQNKTPRLSIWNYNGENASYCNHSGDNKDCYMSVDLGGCEDVYYSNWITYSSDCVDCSYTYSSELCYQCLYCEQCFNCDFCQECEQCMDLKFCFNCKDCKSCFGCTNLRNKSYYIYNKKVNRIEYEDFINKFKGSYKAQQEAFNKHKKILKNTIHRHAVIIDSENCTGDYIYHSKNAKYCYDAVRLWDCKYCYNTLDVRNGYDLYQPGFADSELIYEEHGGNTNFNDKFMNISKNMSDSEYCDQCFNSRDIFGCISIKRGQYIILNKQYSEKKYFELKKQIIDHMKKIGEYGEFFPFWYSPFGYNESKAQEYYPLTKKEAVKIGANWSDYKSLAPTGTKIDLPDKLEETDNSVLEKIIICEKSGKPFKIIKQEYNFYRRKGLPIPRISPQKRYEARMEMRNPRNIYTRECKKCGQQVKTTYDNSRPEPIYCEKCYLEAIY